MNEDEKLEQAEMMKGKGTSFFKVSHGLMTPDVPSDEGEFSPQVNDKDYDVKAWGLLGMQYCISYCLIKPSNNKKKNGSSIASGN